MGVLHKVWRRVKFVGVIVCLATALLLFFEESTSGRRDAARPYIGVDEDNSWYEFFNSTYPASEDDERIVSYVTSAVEDFTRKDNITMELVGCYLERWFRTSRYPVLTRSVRHFARDDTPFPGVTFPRKWRVVFLCYKKTGIWSPNRLVELSLESKSTSPRRGAADDLLIVITRDPESKVVISWQLPHFPNDFKEVIHFDGSFRPDRFSPIDCIKKLYVTMSLGHRISYEYEKRVSSVRTCLSEWVAVDERKSCPRRLSKMEELKRMEFGYMRMPPMAIWFSSDLEPCVNGSFRVSYTVQHPERSARLPIVMDNGIAAFAFDRGVSSFENRGDVYNLAILCMMTLLGATLWLLSDAPSTDSYLALLCTVTSSGGCSETLKKTSAVAALAWLLGNMFFAQVLLDDMTSKITVQDNSRVPQIRNCEPERSYLHQGRLYMITNVIMFLRGILKPEPMPFTFEWIICDIPSEADGLRRSFDFKNFYQIKLGSGERKTSLSTGQGYLPCPREVSATTCRIVNSFVDNSEWNDYASIMLRYDLLKSHVREYSRVLNVGYRNMVETSHGCCRKGLEPSKEILRFLSKFKPAQSAPEESQDEFPWEFMGICNGIAVFFFAVECLCHSIPRLWSWREILFSRMLERSRRLARRWPSRRRFPTSVLVFIGPIVAKLSSAIECLTHTARQDWSRCKVLLSRMLACFRGFKSRRFSRRVSPD